MKCLDITFYDFCMMLKKYENSNECFYKLLAEYLKSCRKCRLYFEKSLLDYKQKLDIVNEHNYVFIMKDFDKFFELEENEKDENDEKNNIFYYYKALLAKNLSVDINKNSTCEEVFSYLSLLDQ